jgi:cytochrome c oxidase subunit 1
VKRRSTQGKSRREESGSFIRTASSRLPPPGSALLVVGSVFLVLSGVAGLALGAELARPGLGFLSLSRYDDLLADHAVYAVYLGLWPLAVGAALAVVRTGRVLGAAGAGLVIAGGVVVYDALRRQATFAYGWTSYAPTTALSHLERIERELAIGMALALVGLACAALPLVGRRSPLAAAVAASAGVLPFLVAAQVAQAADAFWSTPRHVAWAAVVLPAVGAAGEVVARATGRPLPTLYGAGLAAFVLVAATVWLEHTIRAPFGESGWESTALAVPVALAVAAVLAAAATRGAPPTLPILFAAAAILQLVAGGALGAWVAAQDPSLHWMDTQLVNAHLHLALLGGLCGLLALAHAEPRFDPRLGAATLALLVAGTGTFAAAEAVAGHSRMPRRVADYAPQFADVNLAATIGGALTAVALLLFAANCAQAARRPRRRR